MKHPGACNHVGRRNGDPSAIPGEEEAPKSEDYAVLLFPEKQLKSTVIKTEIADRSWA
jgi:hypothetical protein